MRSMLPDTMAAWRKMEDGSAWSILAGHLQREGYTLWDGYITLLPFRRKPVVFDEYIRHGSVLTPREVPQLNLCRPNLAAMRHRDGRDVVCKVIVVKGKGTNVLDAHRRLAGGRPENHVLPLLREIVFQDIIIGVYPLLLASLEWPVLMPDEGGTSLGDALDLLAQTLEGLAYMHERRVAHRDVYAQNLMITYHPNSYKTQKVPARRPTVFIIDLDGAECFPEEMSLDECRSTACPFNEATYRRARPPGITWASYNPFHLDMWQLGQDFGRLKAPEGMKELQAFLDTLEKQTNAQDTCESLCRILGRIPPAELLVRVERDPPNVVVPF